MDAENDTRKSVPWRLVAVALLYAALVCWMIESKRRMDDMVERIEAFEERAADAYWRDAQGNVRRMDTTPTWNPNGVAQDGRDTQHRLCGRRCGDDAPAA